MYNLIQHKVVTTLLKYNSFIITTHVNPDADAIGSQLAICYFLQKLGKNCHLINHSLTPYYLEFLDKEKQIEKYDSEKHDFLILEADCLLIVDLNRINRTVSMEKIIRSFDKEIIFIDHHEDPENLGLKLVDITYSSTGEIVYDLIKNSELVEIDINIAENLYAAIMTDTGSFRFDRTNEATHIKTAELISKGAVPNLIYQQIYEQNNFSKIKLLGEVLSDITLNETGEIAYMIITQDLLKKNNSSEEEVDGYVNFCLSIKGVKIGLLFFELNNGIKISFRSRGEIAVNKLAKEYGGGGHLNAAGARLFNVNLNGYVDKVLESAKKYL